MENAFVCPDQLSLSAGHLKVLALTDMDGTVRYVGPAAPSSRETELLDYTRELAQSLYLLDIALLGHLAPSTSRSPPPAPHPPPCTHTGERVP